jgi:lysozyme
MILIPEFIGIDVSHWQGIILWEIVSKWLSGFVRFAYIKASEGINWMDKQFKYNWAEARAYGLPRGPYHFFRPKQDAIQQADFFASLVCAKNASGRLIYQGDLPPMLDVEVKDGVKPFYYEKGVLNFLARFKALTGVTCGIYTGPGAWNDLLPRNSWAHKYILWDANYRKEGPPLLPIDWAKYKVEQTFWQKADNGEVAGISTKVDIDEFNGDYEKFKKVFKIGTPDPIPEPPKEEDKEEEVKVRKAKVLVGALNIRQKPTTSSPIVGKLLLREEPLVIGEEIVDAKGNTWLQIGWKQYIAKVYDNYEMVAYA